MAASVARSIICSAGIIGRNDLGVALLRIAGIGGTHRLPADGTDSGCKQHIGRTVARDAAAYPLALLALASLGERSPLITLCRIRGHSEHQKNCSCQTSSTINQSGPQSPANTSARATTAALTPSIGVRFCSAAAWRLPACWRIRWLRRNARPEAPMCLSLASNDTTARWNKRFATACWPSVWSRRKLPVSACCSSRIWSSRPQSRRR